MRSSTVIIAAAAIAASAAPTLAAPTSRAAALLARQQATVDESGALSFQDIENGAKKVFTAVQPLIQAGAAIAPLFLRDEAASQLLARAILDARADNDVSGALSFDDIKNGAVNVFNGITDVAGSVAPAISAVSDLLDAIPHKSKPAKATRDVDESGAFSFDDIKNGAKAVFNDVTDVANAVTPAIQAVSGLLDVIPHKSKASRDEILNAVMRRAMLQARADVEESGAFSFDDIKNGAINVFNGITDVASSVTPAISAVTDLLGAIPHKSKTTRDDLESGAFSFQDVKDFAQGAIDDVVDVANSVTPAIQAVTGVLNAIPHKSKTTRDVDASGALSFDDIKNGAINVFNGITDVASSVAPAISAVSGLLDAIPHKGKTTREDLMNIVMRRAILQARDNLDSGALSFDDIKNGAVNVLNGITDVAGSVAPAISAVSDLLDAIPHKSKTATPKAARSLFDLD